MLNEIPKPALPAHQLCNYGISGKALDDDFQSFLQKKFGSQTKDESVPTLTKTKVWKFVKYFCLILGSLLLIYSLVSAVIAEDGGKAKIEELTKQWNEEAFRREGLHKAKNVIEAEIEVSAKKADAISAEAKAIKLKYGITEDTEIAKKN